jgi:hypothetical protein
VKPRRRVKIIPEGQQRPPINILQGSGRKVKIRKKRRV